MQNTQIATKVNQLKIDFYSAMGNFGDKFNYPLSDRLINRMLVLKIALNANSNGKGAKSITALIWQ